MNIQEYKKYRSKWELAMAIHLDELHISYEHDYRFDERRRFLFDFAIIDKMIAIEVEGLTHEGGRHQRINGFMRDCEKYNLAVQKGWKLFRIPSYWLMQTKYYKELQDFLAVIASF